jgi:hypothetical protein
MIIYYIVADAVVFPKKILKRLCPSQNDPDKKTILPGGISNRQNLSVSYITNKFGKRTE